MAFWWPLIVLGFAFAICKFLLMLIPPNVPSIDVDASDGIIHLCLSLSIYLISLFVKFYVGLLILVNGSVG